jgi:hypothetical protein
MKDLNEIIQQFNDIQDLPICEEIIGAYLEGNLAGADLRDVQNLLNTNDSLFNMVDSLGDIDKGMDALISTPKARIGTPSVLGLDDLSNSTTVNEEALSSARFSFNNGENIFEMDFGHIDALQHNTQSFVHENGTDLTSHEYDQLNQTSND